MSWLEDRLAKWGPFRRGAAAVADREETAEAGAFATNQPPLMLLVNDASGRASFKTHVFADAESATDFVLYWFPNQSQGGIIAFWAMTEPPEFGLDSPSETAAEAVVMIRDVTRDGVVYLFSFVDMTSAHAFLREEVRHGTDLGVMMLYWAVPVRLTADPWGKMMLTPSLPPGVVRDTDDEAPINDLWSPPPAAPVMEIARQAPEEDARAVFEEAPNARTGVADPMGGIDDSFELTAWMDRPRRKASKPRDAEPAKPRFEPQPDQDRPDWATTHFEPRPAFSAVPEAADERVFAPAQPEQPADVPPVVEEVVQEAPAAEMPVMEEIVNETVEAAEAPVVEDAVSEEAPAPVEAAADAEPREHLSIELRDSYKRVHTNGNGHKPIETEDDVRSLNGPEVVAKPPRKARQNGHHPEDVIRPLRPERHEAREPDEIHAVEETATPAAQAGEGTGEDDYANQGLDIRIDIRLESSRAMKIKRWEVKEDPFDGFNSPPGRF